jgi:hypothetical protein
VFILCLGRAFNLGVREICIHHVAERIVSEISKYWREVVMKIQDNIAKMAAR